MAKRKLTPRQEEITGLMKGQPGITANEIAVIMETTPQAVYQQISRLRKLKVLPPRQVASAKRKAPAKPAAQREREPKGPPPAPTRPEPPTLESVLTVELTSVVTDLAEAKQAKEAAALREAQLEERKKRLDAVEKALAA